MTMRTEKTVSKHEQRKYRDEYIKDVTHMYEHEKLPPGERPPRVYDKYLETDEQKVERKARQMDKHYGKSLARQVAIVNQLLPCGPLAMLSAIEKADRLKNLQPRSASSLLKNTKKFKEDGLPQAKPQVDRVLYKQRQQELDERIRRHFNYPKGPLALTQGIHKSISPTEGGGSERSRIQAPQQRLSNKIEIEQVLRLQKKNYQTMYLDTTMDFISKRGSDYGLALASFVKEQMSHEEQDVLREEIQVGLQSMQMLKAQPNEHVHRYWKDKMRQIKAYIKANNYPIKIPKPLEFTDSEEEMMQEARQLQVEERQRRTKITEIPPATVSSKARNTRITEESQEGATNFSVDAKRHTFLGNFQVAEESRAIKAELTKTNESSGSILRPTTAQPLTRPKKAISITAAKYGSHANHYKQKQRASAQNTDSTPKNKTLTLDAQSTALDGLLKVTAVRQNKRPNRRHPRQGDTLLSVPDDPASSQDGKLDSFTRGWLNLDLKEQQVQQYPSGPNLSVNVTGEIELSKQSIDQSLLNHIAEMGSSISDLRLAVQSQGQGLTFQSQHTPMEKGFQNDVSTLKVKQAIGTMHLLQPPVSDFQQPEDVAKTSGLEEPYLHKSDDYTASKEVTTLAQSPNVSKPTTSKSQNKRIEPTQQIYKVLPLTSIPMAESSNLERPYRSMALIQTPPDSTSQKKSRERPSSHHQRHDISRGSVRSLLTTSHNNKSSVSFVRGKSCLALQPQQQPSSMSPGSKQLSGGSSRNAKRQLQSQQQLLLSHPNQIKIQTMSRSKVGGKSNSIKGSSRSIDRDHKRNASSVDLSAGLHYYDTSNAAGRQKSTKGRASRNISAQVLSRSIVTQEIQQSPKMLAESSGKKSKQRRKQEDKRSEETYQEASSMSRQKVDSRENLINADVGPINISTGHLQAEESGCLVGNESPQQMYLSQYPEAEAEQTEQTFVFNGAGSAQFILTDDARPVSGSGANQAVDLDPELKKINSQGSRAKFKQTSPQKTPKTVAAVLQQRPASSLMMHRSQMKFINLHDDKEAQDHLHSIVVRQAVGPSTVSSKSRKSIAKGDSNDSKRQSNPCTGSGLKKIRVESRQIVLQDRNDPSKGARQGKTFSLLPRGLEAFQLLSQDYAANVAYTGKSQRKAQGLRGSSSDSDDRIFKHQHQQVDIRDDDVATTQRQDSDRSTSQLERTPKLTKLRSEEQPNSYPEAYASHSDRKGKLTGSSISNQQERLINLVRVSPLVRQTSSSRGVPRDDESVNTILRTNQEAGMLKGSYKQKRVGSVEASRNNGQPVVKSGQVKEQEGSQASMYSNLALKQPTMFTRYTSERTREQVAHQPSMHQDLRLKVTVIPSNLNTASIASSATKPGPQDPAPTRSGVDHRSSHKCSQKSFPKCTCGGRFEHQRFSHPQLNNLLPLQAKSLTKKATKKHQRKSKKLGRYPTLTVKNSKLLDRRQSDHSQGRLGDTMEIPDVSPAASERTNSSERAHRQQKAEEMMQAMIGQAVKQRDMHQSNAGLQQLNKPSQSGKKAGKRQWKKNESSLYQRNEGDESGIQVLLWNEQLLDESNLSQPSRSTAPEGRTDSAYPPNYDSERQTSDSQNDLVLKGKMRHRSIKFATNNRYLQQRASKKSSFSKSKSSAFMTRQSRGVRSPAMVKSTKNSSKVPVSSDLQHLVAVSLPASQLAQSVHGDKRKQKMARKNQIASLRPITQPSIGADSSMFDQPQTHYINLSASELRASQGSALQQQVQTSQERANFGRASRPTGHYSRKRKTLPGRKSERGASNTDLPLLDNKPSLYGTIDSNVYKDGVEWGQPRQGAANQFVQGFGGLQSEGQSANRSLQNISICLQTNPARQMTSVKVNTLSMDSSIQIASLRQELRDKRAGTSLGVQGGITKMGGFRRPTSSTFYQVKRTGVHRCFSKKAKQINADLPASGQQTQKQHQGQEQLRARLVAERRQSCDQASLSEFDTQQVDGGLIKHKTVSAAFLDTSDRECYSPGLVSLNQSKN